MKFKLYSQNGKQTPKQLKESAIPSPKIVKDRGNSGSSESPRQSATTLCFHTVSSRETRGRTRRKRVRKKVTGEKRRRLFQLGAWRPSTRHLSGRKHRPPLSCTLDRNSQPALWERWGFRPATNTSQSSAPEESGRILSLQPWRCWLGCQFHTHTNKNQSRGALFFKWISPSPFPPPTRMFMRCWRVGGINVPGSRWQWEAPLLGEKKKSRPD